MLQTKFYEVNQNNSGGGFDVDDKLCHRLYIEAVSEDDAMNIAESLGCYWNGVEEGMDCPCCGDRWYGVGEIDLNKINTKWKGEEVSIWVRNDKSTDDIIKEINTLYPNARWHAEPIVEKKYGSYRVVGRMLIDNIEQYAQLKSHLWGGNTKPDGRIFYKDGTVKEF
jgi:hypothetical protein